MSFKVVPKLVATITKVVSRGIFFPASILLTVAGAMRAFWAWLAWLQPRSSRRVRMRSKIRVGTRSTSFR